MGHLPLADGLAWWRPAAPILARRTHRPTPVGPRRVGGRTYTAAVRTRWLSRRSLLLHLLVLVVAPACLLAGWWQATVALSGNALSWVYTVEWPAFAALAVYGWWHLLHEDPAALRARKDRVASFETDTTGWDITGRALKN